MASFIYDTARASFLGIASGSINWTNDRIKAVLVANTYTPSAAHQFVDPSLWAHTGSVVAQELTAKTGTAGEAGAANVTFTAVAGPTVYNCVVLYKESGNNSRSQWQLIAQLDSANITGLPLTGSGADVTISWNTGVNKIFKL